jgi:hypothetical protein
MEGMAAAGATNAGGLFYPLQVGNRWEFEHRLTATHIPIEGPAWVPVGFEYRRLVELTGTAEIHGREYVIERSDYVSSSPIEPSLYYLRQDFGGLYESDDGPVAAPRAAVAPQATGDDAWSVTAARLGISTADPAWRRAWERIEAKLASVREVARAAARPGPAAGEIQSLRYPLHPGASWIIRDDPRFSAEVEGAVTLDTPAGRFTAWSLRIRNEFITESDEVHLYYGRAGYLGLWAHLTTEVTDEQGNPAGILDVRETETLEALAPVAGGARREAPLGGPVATGE